jgi:hypothetical protein
MCDRSVRESEREKLVARDHPVLPPGDAPRLAIQLVVD